MKAISKKSMKNPSRKITRFATTRKPSRPPGSPVNISSIHRSPYSPRNTSENAVEPSSRNITIEVRRVVCSSASASERRSSLRFAAASASAPTAPSAPASVGVATPAKMLPSTSRIRTSGGTITSATWRSSSSPNGSRSSAGSAGAICGRTNANTATNAAYRQASRIPGSRLPTNRSPTEIPI